MNYDDIMLAEFVRESNRIEGINRALTPEEIRAHERLLMQPCIMIRDLVQFITAIAPGNHLRNEPGMDVRVGSYIPPQGGLEVALLLGDLLKHANERRLSAHAIHVRYEKIHPFTDGNGRSGRALWLWMCGGNAPLGFLHHFYYDTLAAAEGV